MGFEMWMLQQAQEQLSAWDASSFKTKDARALFQFIATLECFLVHVRSLLYFFYPPRRPQVDDLVPRDLLAPSIRWPHSRDSMPPRERRWIIDINRALQHLSRQRSRPRVDWNEKAMRAAIETLFAELNILKPRGGPIAAAHPDHNGPS